MKILFLTEYFWPYVHGGAEQSIFYLSQALVRSGEEIYILTPNYGNKSREIIDGIEVFRFPFHKKLKNFSDQLTPAYYFNPLYILWQTFQIVSLARRERIQILHSHSLYSLPALVLAGKILNLPTVMTFRDNQVLCNYGFCLSQDQYAHSCNLKDYFLKDFKNYYETRVTNKSAISLLIQLAMAIFGRIRTKTFKFLSKFVSVQIVSSYSQQKTFAGSDFHSTKVIYNLYPNITKPKTHVVTKEYLLYATKLSPGKGLDLLLAAFASISAKLPKIKLLVIGQGDIEKYQKLSQELKVSDKIKFIPRLNSEELMKIRQTALLEIAPSIYPESFGRVALEALVDGTPTIVSNRGGLKEIVEDKVTGYVVEPKVEALAEAIINGVNNNHKLRSNIAAQYPELKKKFELGPVKEHILLYRSL